MSKGLVKCVLTMLSFLILIQKLRLTKIHNCTYYKEDLQPISLSFYFSPQERTLEIYYFPEIPGMSQVLKAMFSLTHISLIRREKYIRIRIGNVYKLVIYL